MNYEEGQALLQSGTTLVYVLQRRATAITKWAGLMYVLKRSASVIAKWGSLVHAL